MTTVALYARVSAKDKGQSTENQLPELRRFAQAYGYTVYKEYVEHEWGGMGKRSEFQALFADAHQRRFDLVLFWSLDRFSREGVLPTLQYLNQLQGWGVGYKSLTEQYLDSVGLFQEAIISILATLAKQERVRLSMGYGDYVEQITYLLFLKMADEQAGAPNAPAVPAGKDWESLRALEGDALEVQTSKDTLSYERTDFVATTSNKQLNFVQHIYTILKVGGTAAVVLPENVLFEGGAGETIRRKLLQDCNVHTLLRLPTGIFYAQDVKANVIFFKKRAAEQAQTQALWVYDLRTNQHFTPKSNPLTLAHLQDFIACYGAPGQRAQRQETEQFHRYELAQLLARDKVNLDIFRLKDDALEDSATLPAPDVLALEITENLQAALAQFASIAEELEVEA